MKKMHVQEQGFGLLVIIAIIAVVGIGGVAVAQIYSSNQAKVTVDEKEMMENENSQRAAAQVRADVVSTLAVLQSDILAGAKINIATTLQTLTDLRADLAEVTMEANAELRAELVQIDAQLVQLETQIQNESTEAKTTISDIMAGIEVGVTSSTGAQNDDETTEGEVDTTESKNGIDADLDSSVDSDVIDGESNASAEGSATLSI